MSTHREERRFRIEIELSAEFGPDYEGDDDGYAWAARWQHQVRPQLVQAVLATLARAPGFRVTPVSRGASAEDALEVDVRFVGAAPAAAPRPPRPSS
jgi:hypothetical protein